MIRLAVFASGRGSNFQTIHRHIESGEIPATIVLLISDNERAGALTYAQETGIAVSALSPQKFAAPLDFGEALIGKLRQYRVDYVVLAGYLKKIPENVVAAFADRMLNIHPALLPAFGGKGMYGMRVHEAVYRAGVKVSGVTVHLVNGEYDAGPIVLQRAVDISDCRSPAEIAARVLAEEHLAYPAALKLLVKNKIIVAGQRVSFQPPEKAGGEILPE